MKGTTVVAICGITFTQLAQSRRNTVRYQEKHHYAGPGRR
jgi:hypothetical protein